MFFTLLRDVDKELCEAGHGTDGVVPDLEVHDKTVAGLRVGRNCKCGSVLTVAGQTETVEASLMLRLSAGIREMIRS